MPSEYTNDLDPIGNTTPDPDTVFTVIVYNEEVPLVVASSTCNLAKYFDYFVYGNMIILCQGKDIEQSVNNCRFILSKLENTPQ